MEIAHAQTKTLRVIGKLIVLGLLVILLAKVLLALLALAAVGLLTYVGARTLYNRRAFVKRVLSRTTERLIHSFTSTRSAARWTSCIFSTLAETLKAFAVLVCLLVCYLAKIGCALAWKLVRKLAMVMTCALVGFFCCIKRTAAASIQAAGGALARIRSQSGVIFGIFVEGVSGALIGAMLGFVPSFLPHEQPIEVRVWGAALLGGFLGIMVALSRTTWAKQGEQSSFLEN